MLRYLAGDTEDMIEEQEEEKATVIEGDEDDDDIFELPDPNELLTIEDDIKDACADISANVIIKNIDNIDHLADERVRFFFEEISGAISDALDKCDFSQDNFEIWYEGDYAGTNRW